MDRQRWLRSGLCCLVSVLGGTAIAQTVILDFHAVKVLGAVHIAGGTIELEGGAALIVTTSAFGFVPFGTQANEYMVNGVGRAEYGTPAIHDAIVEGANFAHGFWNGTNGFVSLDAQYQTDRNFTIGWLDNAIAGDTSWYGKPVNSSQTIIANGRSRRSCHRRAVSAGNRHENCGKQRRQLADHPWPNQRQRRTWQGRPRQADFDRLKHILGRHDDQRRHAAIGRRCHRQRLRRGDNTR
jgi:hypothetical protein